MVYAHHVQSLPEVPFTECEEAKSLQGMCCAYNLKQRKVRLRISNFNLRIKTKDHFVPATIGNEHYFAPQQVKRL